MNYILNGIFVYTVCNSLCTLYQFLSEGTMTYLAINLNVKVA